MCICVERKYLEKKDTVRSGPLPRAYGSANTYRSFQQTISIQCAVITCDIYKSENLTVAVSCAAVQRRTYSGGRRCKQHFAPAAFGMLCCYQDEGLRYLDKQDDVKFDQRTAWRRGRCAPTAGDPGRGTKTGQMWHKSSTQMVVRHNCTPILDMFHLALKVGQP